MLYTIASIMSGVMLVCILAAMYSYHYAKKIGVTGLKTFRLVVIGCCLIFAVVGVLSFPSYHDNIKQLGQYSSVRYRSGRGDSYTATMKNGKKIHADEFVVKSDDNKVVSVDSTLHSVLFGTVHDNQSIVTVYGPEKPNLKNHSIARG